MEVTWEKVGQTFTDVWIQWNDDNTLGKEIGRALRQAIEDYKKETGKEVRTFFNQAIQVLKDGSAKQFTIVVDVYEKTAFGKMNTGNGIYVDMVKPEPPTCNSEITNPATVGIHQYYNKPF